MIELVGGMRFDDKKERDPVDRAVVDKLRLYVKEHGGTSIEFEYDGSWNRVVDSADFMFGWEGNTVSFFECSNHFHEIVPPNMLAELRNLQTVVTGLGYEKDFSFLGEIKNLSELVIISIPDNGNVFPINWACTSTLHSVSLSNREYSSRRVPEWLGTFPNIKKILLAGRFKSIPHSLVQIGLPFIEDKDAQHGIILDATLDQGDVGMYLTNDRELIEAFYSGEQITEGQAIRECKVIFLGDGGVGKSSLIERMMKDTFELGKLPTDGMRVIPWMTKLKDDRDFRIRFLDFGGQEIMHSMHRCFLSGHTVYVVVCAARDDTEIDGVAARWLEQVKAFAPGCPVILALNKADENPGISVNETNLRKRFPALKAVLKTSASDGKGSAFYAGRLYTAIMEYAPSCVQELKGNRGMLAVKQALEQMSAQKQPYITSDEYRKLCEKNKITGNVLQKSLLKWFRDLGVAYFYEREQVDLRLESLRVLNPVWLTNGIYRLILRAGEKVKNGIVTHDDIREILATSYEGDAEDVVYSPEETEYVLHVMRMFEISHEIAGGRELIPMLMDKNAKDMDAFSNQEVHERWEGAFLPNNLIHRLMIQKHQELDTDLMWRTGARFQSKKSLCTAAAIMTDDKSLDLYVMYGDNEEQRQYLNSFRERIEAILHSLNLGETKELICFTANGKEGNLPYKAVELAYKNGDEKIMVPSILEYVSPAELLKRVEKIKPSHISEPERTVIQMPAVQYTPAPPESPKPEGQKPDQPSSSETGEKESKQTNLSESVEIEKKKAEMRQKKAETRKTNLTTMILGVGFIAVLALVIYGLITGEKQGITLPEAIKLLFGIK